MKKILLSVIICTYNRDWYLNNCLFSLFCQTLGQTLFEIIVVDNNSSDKTKQIVSHYMKLIPNIRYVKEKNQGLSFARNKGCKKAKGEYLVYLDDDVRLEENYLENVYGVIKKQQPDILGGPVYPYYTNKKPFWFKDQYVLRKHTKKSGFTTKSSITGANYVIKKDILISLGMFDKNYGMIGDNLGIGEERKILDLYRKIIPFNKQKVYYSLECFVNHHISKDKLNLKYQLKRSFIAGKMWARLRKELELSVKCQKSKRFEKFLWFILLPGYYAMKTVKRIIKKGIIRVDYVLVLLQIFFEMGIILEHLRLKLKLYKNKIFFYQVQ